MEFTKEELAAAKEMGYSEADLVRMTKEKANWDQPKAQHDERIHTGKDGKPKDYSAGESSAYWNHLDKKANVDGDRSNSGEAELIESFEANPDVLGDTFQSTPQAWIPEGSPEERKAQLKKSDEANRLARLYLNKNQLELWNCAIQNPTDSWREIGAKLGISEKAVESRLKTIRNKLAPHFKK